MSRYASTIHVQELMTFSSNQSEWCYNRQGSEIGVRPLDRMIGRFVAVVWTLSSCCESESLRLLSDRGGGVKFKLLSEIYSMQRLLLTRLAKKAFIVTFASGRLYFFLNKHVLWRNRETDIKASFRIISHTVAVHEGRVQENYNSIKIYFNAAHNQCDERKTPLFWNFGPNRAAMTSSVQEAIRQIIFV